MNILFAENDFPVVKGTEMTRSAVANGDMRWNTKSSLVGTSGDTLAK
jgi:hypothetical protein